MVTDVGLSEFKLAARRRRQATLVAALAATSTSQTDLVRKLTLDGAKTAISTVNRWCTGVVEIDADTLEYVLGLIGLPADWQPPTSG
jgi:hypothetical protein